jgi:hypothetical protein
MLQYKKKLLPGGKMSTQFLQKALSQAFIFTIFFGGLTIAPAIYAQTSSPNILSNHPTVDVNDTSTSIKSVNTVKNYPNPTQWSYILLPILAVCLIAYLLNQHQPSNNGLRHSLNRSTLNLDAYRDSTINNFHPLANIGLKGGSSSKSVDNYPQTHQNELIDFERRLRAIYEENERQSGEHPYSG